MKTYSNDRGEGCLFSVNFLDASGEISCSLFNDLATKYWNIFEEGKIFYISKGKVKNAGKWNPVASDFELSLNSQSEVMECTLGDPAIPNVSYKFVPLISLLEYSDNKLVGSFLWVDFFFFDPLDLMCVLYSVSDCATVTSKTKKELLKRDLTLVDNSSGDPNVALRYVLFIQLD